MTNSGDRPNPQPRRPRRLWLWAGVGAGVVLLAGGAIVAWQIRLFIRDRLIPLVEDNLSQTIGRPVDLGPLEAISLRGARVGRSSLPPTETDQDTVTIDAIDLGINLWALITTRTLRLDIRLINPDLFLDQEADGRWIAIELKERDEEPGLIKTEIDQLTLENGTVVLAPAPPDDLVELRAEVDRSDRLRPTSEREYPLPIRVEFQQVNGQAFFRDENQRISFDTTARPKTGGQLRVRGGVNLRENAVNLAVLGSGLAAPDISALLRSPLILETGRIGANVTVQLRNEEPFALGGTAQFDRVRARIAQIPLPFNEARGLLRFQGQQINLENVRATYGQVPARADGSIHLEDGYNITAQARSLPITDLLRTFELNSPVPLRGRINADLRVTGPLDEPLLTGQGVNTGSVRIDRVDFSRLQTRFSLTPDALSFSGIEAVPTSGGSIRGSGQFNLKSQRAAVALRGENLAGDAIAQLYGANTTAFSVGRVGADVRVGGRADALQTFVQWRAPEATYPAQGEVFIAGDTIRFENTRLQVAGGEVRGRGVARNNRWEAFISAAGVRLQDFSPDLRGLLGGTVRLAGRLDNFSPSAIRAEGNVDLSEGIALLDRPLSAQILWDGRRLAIQRATGPDFEASGFVFAQLEGPNAPAISGFDLTMSLRNYDINDLPIPQPEQLQLSGLGDFNGRLTGTPDAPNVVGQVRLNRFVVNSVPFEPVLTGDIRFFTNRGLALDLAGQRDRIAVTLNGENRPLAFLIQRGDAIAEGQGDGERLAARLRNFPLQILGLRPIAGFGIVSGIASGRFDLNIADLNNPAIAGEVVIDRPALGYVFADRFAGRFSYASGSAILEDSELRRDGSRYRIAARYDATGPTPGFSGRIVADEGRIEDILTALQIFDLEDFARGLQPATFASAAQVSTVALDTFGRTLLNQLRRYSEITRLVEQQAIARQQNSQFPDLAELQGAFTGVITFQGTPQNGVSAAFNLRGRDWLWGEYAVEEVIAEGDFQNGQVTLTPLSLQRLTLRGEPSAPAPDAAIAFTGQIGGAEQNGQLRVQNVPVALLREVVPLPLDLDGNLNATALLTGRQNNPLVNGEIQVNDARLNDVPLETARLFFDYTNARLNFTGRLNIVNEDEPLIAQGSIPYASPLTDPTIDPGRNIDVQVSTQGSGLKLIDILSRNQVTWQGGSGFLRARVEGTLQQPTIQGRIQFSEAQFGGQVLPEPITNVQGNILFNGDRILIPSLTGQFSRGQLLVGGTIPIFNAALALPPPPEPTAPADGMPTPPVLSLDGANLTTPLTIQLEQLTVDLRNLYAGSVDGQVVITGTALAPRIGGAIALQNGVAVLPGGGEQPAEEPTDQAIPDVTTPPVFNNFQLAVAENVRVRGPNLNFGIDGTVLVNGPPNDLELQGTIFLRNGQVNLYTTNFVVDRRYTSRVDFLPNRGLNPNLDVQLITSVLEATRRPLFQTTTEQSSAEIADTPIGDLGAFQTIRIQASVQGPADEVFQNIELSSSPQRSDREILALLGGGFVEELGEGNAGLAIANLAGSALLNNVQNFISRAVGLTDLRLYPTSIGVEGGELNFGLAAELGVDITNDLSVSALQILTDEIPTQFNVRYRLSDQFTLRGSTNLEGESRAVLEFQTRF